MSDWKTWHWDGLGWAMFGPLGNIITRAMNPDAELDEEELDEESFYPRTRAGDFGLSLMVLLPAVMKADLEVTEPELDFVNYFFVTAFGGEEAQDLMILLSKILELDYFLEAVCHQISILMDYPSRLELIYLLFGLAKADAHIDPEEIQVIKEISHMIGVSPQDSASIEAMFVPGPDAPYQVLQVGRKTGRQGMESAYHEMVDKHHPDQVGHLGEEFQKLAGEKLRAVEKAYQQIRQERGWD